MRQQQKDGVSKNFAYQFIYQFVILVIPLVVSPYLTRVVGSKELGAYTFVNSITTYFIMFANLGIAKYGQRTIARSAHEPEQLRRSFWSLFTVHAIVSVITILLYYVFAVCFVNESKAIYYIQGLRIIAALFDLTWFFYGIESFKSVVIRNTVARVLETLLVFIFVKKPADTIYLSTIYSVGSLISQLVMIPLVLRIAPPIRIKRNETTAHIKPLFVFAISVIAVSLYTVFDKILLGWLTVKDNVAYYEYADRIISLPRTFIVVIGTVMFPRACSLAAKGDYTGQKRYLHYSLVYTYFIGFAALFGFLSISEKLAYVYYGPGFAESGRIMIAMCALPVIVGLGDIIRTQYMIPNGLDKQYIICILANAGINLVLSTSLIPIIGIYGAVVGTCSAELFGCIYQLIVCKKYISARSILQTSVPFVIIGGIMFAVIKFVSLFTTPLTWISLLIEIGVGAFVYIILSGIYIYFRENDLWIEVTKRIPFLNRI